MAEKKPILASIIINNYNYGSYLKEAIDSSLNQTYPWLEVVVVDDGSADNSPEIIDEYGEKIISVIKENGGQASAFNAGFAASTGEVLFFLDSDDVFYPDKVAEIVELFVTKTANNPYVMVYHLLECVDQKGASLGQKIPEKLYSVTPNLYEYACRYRFFPFAASPTSGIAMSRALAQLIFPIPEKGVLTSADEFIVRPALLLGETYGVERVLAKYRIHDTNNWYGKSKVKTKEFIAIIEDFLNKKLQENNKKPAISYFDSMTARNYYMSNGSSKDVLALLLKVPNWGINWTTIKFSLKTTLLALGLMFKQKLRT